MNKRVFTILILIVFLSFSLHAFAQSRTDWEINYGEGIELFTTGPASEHGEKFNDYIPAEFDPNWTLYMGPENINFFDIPSSMCGADIECLEGGQFTYFRTYVDVPADVTELIISAEVIVDGLRITINGTDVATIGPGEEETENLIGSVVLGTVNTVVLTHVDDCCYVSALNDVKIVMDGQVVYTCPPPIVEARETLTVHLDASGNADITLADVFIQIVNQDEVCEINSMSIAPSAFTCNHLGDNIVTTMVTDVKGNSGTDETIVSVVDIIAPTFSDPPGNITEYNEPGQCGKVVSWTPPGATDVCDVNVEVTRTGPEPGSTFPAQCPDDPDLGTKVTYSAVDDSGNVATHEFMVTVLDNEDPVMSNCPADIEVNNDPGLCGAYVSWTPPTFTDNCEGMVVTSTHDPGDFFAASCESSPEPIEVKYTAVDQCGNPALECIFTVTVLDNEAPVMSNCPADIVVVNDPGECGAYVSWTPPTFTDNCEGMVVTSTHSPGDFFPASCESNPIPTTVTYTAVDKCGNTTECIFDVTVLDKEAPVLSITGVEGNYEWLRLEGEYGYWDANAIVFWNTDDIEISYAVTDNCDPNSVITYTVEWEGNALEGVGTLDTEAMTITIDPYLLVGDVEVTITATDYCDNSASASTEFTIILKVSEMVVKPERLCKNRGKFTVFVWFPDPFDVRTIRDALCDGALMLKMNTCGWCKDHICDWCEKYFCDDDCEDDDDEDGVDYCKCHICDWCDHWSTKAILKFDRDDILDSLFDNRFVLRGIFEYNGEEVYFQGYDETKHECAKPCKPKPKPPKYEPCPLFPWSYPVPSVFDKGNKKGKDKGNKYGWGKSSTPICFSWSWDMWSEIPLFYVK
ncbi:MAG: HYR domain-containing protein [bacterium]